MNEKDKKSQPTADQPKVERKQLKKEQKRQKKEDKQRRKEEKREKKRNRSLFRKIFKWTSCLLFFVFLICLIITISFSAIVYANYKQEFSFAEPKSQISSSIFYDKNGEIIYETFGAKKPVPIELSDIPENLIKATIAIEDKEFYDHGAFDIRAIARAAYVNFKASSNSSIKGKVLDIFDESNVVEGGSTITQQLVKNVYLTPERSIQRKLKELVFAIEIENQYSKNEILEMYFNQIYYGEQSIGIYNAAQNYFGKKPEDLNLAECAVLAGLPAAPSKYSPISGDFEEAKSRQSRVLEKMYEMGYLTEEEAKDTINISLQFNPQADYTTMKHPYFINYINEELRGMYDEKFIEEGGLQIYTTIDPDKQKIAEEKANKYVKKFKWRNVSNAGVVIMDPKSNEVQAMVGGVDWEQSKYNVALADRQPGSSFKPVVYATGLKEGYTAASILLDTPISFPGNPPYKPRNYNGSYWGNVTIRTALSNSLNIPAVEMLKLVGIDSAIETAHDMGITTLNEEDRYGLSLVLGGGEVKLLDITGVYATFADGGKKAESHGIDKIVDKDGKVIYQFDRQKKQVLDPRHAYIITSILSDNKSRSRVFGSNSPLKLKDRPAVAKTGTTDNYTDSWTVGYTPDLVVGVWMGNNDHSKMKQMSGLEGASHVWHDIMEECLKDIPAKEFEKPREGIEEVWINPYTGLPTKYKGWSSVLETFVEGTVPEKQDLSYLDEFRYTWK